MIERLEGISRCPSCGKLTYGSRDPELCFACWLLEHPPRNTPTPIGASGAGGWNYYAEPNTIMQMSPDDVLDYLAGCPKSRAIWFDVLHNSATPAYNGIGIVRSFQEYHMSRGWSDIGYHWVITPDGVIYLGRNIVHQGAHAFAEGNRGSMGYCLVGDFSGSGGLPTQAQINSAGFLARAHGAAFGYANHSGHRWVVDPGNPSHSTSCPGTNVSHAMVKQWTSGAAPVPEQEEEEMAVIGSGIPVAKFADSFFIGVPGGRTKREDVYIKALNLEAQDVNVIVKAITDDAIKETQKILEQNKSLEIKGSDLGLTGSVWFHVASEDGSPIYVTFDPRQE